MVRKKKSYPEKMLGTATIMNISVLTPNVYYNIAKTMPGNAPKGIIGSASGAFGMMGLSGFTKSSVDLLGEIRKLNKKKII